MIERVVEYLANAAWQLPLLAVGAWWLLRAVRVGPPAQYRVWVAVLGDGGGVAVGESFAEDGGRAAGGDEGSGVGE